MPFTGDLAHLANALVTTLGPYLERWDFRDRNRVGPLTTFRCEIYFLENDAHPGVEKGSWAVPSVTFRRRSSAPRGYYSPLPIRSSVSFPPFRDSDIGRGRLAA